MPDVSTHPTYSMSASDHDSTSPGYLLLDLATDYRVFVSLECFEPRQFDERTSLLVCSGLLFILNKFAQLLHVDPNRPFVNAEPSSFEGVISSSVDDSPRSGLLDRAPSLQSSSFFHYSSSLPPCTFSPLAPQPLSPLPTPRSSPPPFVPEEEASSYVPESRPPAYDRAEAHLEHLMFGPDFENNRYIFLGEDEDNIPAERLYILADPWHNGMIDDFSEDDESEDMDDAPDFTDLMFPPAEDIPVPPNAPRMQFRPKPVIQAPADVIVNFCETFEGLYRLLTRFLAGFPANHPDFHEINEIDDALHDTVAWFWIFFADNPYANLATQL
ncbi:hypothetical protein Pst134EA_026018 [Puccinia striiformis f. sp. tritici]|uniref:hypothetical protein n=1 Tax=Puccinia striiformis f. sp. tritici TaxID=168172 RepID=UPI002008072F|nr:hypothetical protein Pst134EA_026018 [Puccinia striiformis f. sp. tritici]KAH9452083.1 hypothetical protein Pst134EA_026018 [Puccinia striiformis f. sp. tritici]